MAIQQLLQSRQGGIPPEMAALIQLREAAKVLKQSASAVTPSGQPTVASQDTQQALAMLLPEPPQQPGMQDLMPGVQQRAGEMAQAQQPVTQAQLQQAMAQQAQQRQQPVMAARGGIITLPADIEMAEGGIVGYAGPTGSYVSSPEETVPSEEAAALDELRVAEAKRKRAEAERRRQLEFLKSVGAPQAAQYEEGASATYESMKDTRQIPPGRYAEPAPTQRPAASAPTAQPAAPSGVIDYVDFLNKMMGAQTEGFRKLEESEKPLPKTAEEERYTREYEAETARREADIEARRQRYLTTEQERAKAGKPTKLQELADFFSRVSGPTLFSGLGNAARAHAVIEAERRKETQAALDRRQQYFELLDRERDAIKDRNEALRLNQMDRARAEQEKIRQIQIDKNKLRTQSAVQMFGPTIQAAQSAENTRQNIAARRQMAQARDATLAGIAALKAKSKTAPLPGLNEIFKLEAELSTQFNPKNPGPKGLEYLEKEAPQLYKDIVNGNIKPNSDQWKKEVAPKLAIGAQVYKNSLLSQTKYGAQPMSYSAAASAVGLEDEED